ncbi:MaoC/PaaZ C-terminal domain-containing protein [Paraglaciecola sp.]|uniref:MaoC/PaaZ C-terminal domain-containing protein n=1 Tax=Paraglaciecola sp. TaxID=1920173 RepID=UPI003EF74C13
MNASNVHSEQLAKLPNLKVLMLQALFKRDLKQSSPVLPANELWIENLRLNADSIALFHQVVEWHGASSVLHPCFMHTMAFPIHMKLLLKADFPFSLLGLVHIENTIHQYRPLKDPEQFKLVCRLGELTLHKKGWLFSVITECFCGTELVWKSTSINLSRAKHNLPVENKTNSSDANFTTTPTKLNWDFSEDLGRRYAEASGDYNPIHLRKWSAKLFGFKQQIAHGMFTKSRCISELQNLEPQSFYKEFEVTARFKQPLFIPTKARLSIQQEHKESEESVESVESDFQFKVETQPSQQEPLLHLVGNIEFK